MSAFRRAALVVPLFGSALALAPATAHAELGQCHVIDVGFRPTKRADLDPGKQRGLQIVAWLEDDQGNFVNTIYITAQTGTYGLGNRPGRADFNSGPNWPYGRRDVVFPVWAHKKGTEGEVGSPVLEFPSVVFQNADENNLSHPFNQSSRETHYCRPLQNSGQDKVSWDAGSCASTVFTDKGILSVAAGTSSLYPPRQDIARQAGLDSSSVDMYALLNPYDAISQATPHDDQDALISWPVPATMPNGNYVLFVEVSKEFDHNTDYSIAARPSPSGIPWTEYGEAFRGQPSVIYKVPFTIGLNEDVKTAIDIAGYGDPDGMDGQMRAPDGTITLGVPGSGASRLALVSDGSGMYRVKLISRPEFDFIVPAAPQEISVANTDGRSATVSFMAPGDDGLIGRVKGYEVRYQIGTTVTEANFTDGVDPKPSLQIVDPGTAQSFTLDKLLPETTYSVGVRAFDDCHNTGPLAVVTFKTPVRQAGEVDACFVATAAYGSVMARDVEMLRRFRDTALRHSVLGELFVETYYTFGPPVAGVVGESELLRWTARAVLAPLVSWVRAFHL